MKTIEGILFLDRGKYKNRKISNTLVFQQIIFRKLAEKKLGSDGTVRGKFQKFCIDGIVRLVCTVGYCMVKIRGYHDVGQSSLQYCT